MGRRNSELRVPPCALRAGIVMPGLKFQRQTCERFKTTREPLMTGDARSSRLAQRLVRSGDSLIPDRAGYGGQFGSHHLRGLLYFRAMRVRCPICRRLCGWEGNPFRPFCSERCQLTDLGSWAAEYYRIKPPGEGGDPDLSTDSDTGHTA
jgi:endogenous inhibitor of DNA gyrase (YacG/DUF329 family)